MRFETDVPDDVREALEKALLYLEDQHPFYGELVRQHVVSQVRSQEEPSETAAFMRRDGRLEVVPDVIRNRRTPDLAFQLSLMMDHRLRESGGELEGRSPRH